MAWPARYLSLDGTSAPKRGGALSHVFTTESLASVVSAAVTTGIVYTQSDLRYAFAAAACSTLGVIGAQLAYKKLMGRVLEYYFGDLEKRCFDRVPDIRTPPTKPNHMLAAEKLAAEAPRKTGMITALTLTNAGLMGVAVIVTTPTLAPFVFTVGATITAATLCIPANFLLTARRFNKVAMKEWTIRDYPPPQKVTAKQPVFRTVIQPDPLPM